MDYRTNPTPARPLTTLLQQILEEKNPLLKILVLVSLAGLTAFGIALILRKKS